MPHEAARRPWETGLLLDPLRHEAVDGGCRRRPRSPTRTLLCETADRFRPLLRRLLPLGPPAPTTTTFSNLFLPTAPPFPIARDTPASAPKGRGERAPRPFPREAAASVTTYAATALLNRPLPCDFYRRPAAGAAAACAAAALSPDSGPLQRQSQPTLSPGTTWPGAAVAAASCLLRQGDLQLLVLRGSLLLLLAEDQVLRVDKNDGRGTRGNRKFART